MKKGDIVVVPFPFTDLTGNKLRPALVLISRRDDVTVAFATTQIRWKEPNDVLLRPTDENGLKKDSLIRLSKLATIDSNLVAGIIGEIGESEMRDVNENLIAILRLHE
jgi:mRNA interferase MazF